MIQGSSDDPELREAVDLPAKMRPARMSRRLSDKILLAFHQACDQGDYRVAQALLPLAVKSMAFPSGASGLDRRKSQVHMVAAHERLWHLLHAEAQPKGANVQNLNDTD